MYSSIAHVPHARSAAAAAWAEGMHERSMGRGTERHGQVGTIWHGTMWNGPMLAAMARYDSLGRGGTIDEPWAREAGRWGGQHEVERVTKPMVQPSSAKVGRRRASTTQHRRRDSRQPANAASHLDAAVARPRRACGMGEHGMAQVRPGWDGMGCMGTAARGTAMHGHVGARHGCVCRQAQEPAAQVQEPAQDGKAGTAWRDGLSHSLPSTCCTINASTVQ
ncbi:hypothetical protein DCS_01181 [Drechmeria coniospora]|uniref:Uncharacterized protein n=1 Tax=Drechmeria coniospora TaxID=98403 RepID=A0A151GSG2_DRECN|nr:hypothetical protein DCS_01181 [Drechmeria coniospora]KYK60047.1 hypothetical protein DCS_01181 [Drechmeria coniospora]